MSEQSMEGQRPYNFAWGIVEAELDVEKFTRNVRKGDLRAGDVVACAAWLDTINWSVGVLEQGEVSDPGDPDDRGLGYAYGQWWVPVASMYDVRLIAPGPLHKVPQPNTLQEARDALMDVVARLEAIGNGLEDAPESEFAALTKAEVEWIEDRYTPDLKKAQVMWVVGDGVDTANGSVHDALVALGVDDDRVREYVEGRVYPGRV